MFMTDWKKVADAIRAGRFDDITSDEWEQVADKLVSLAPKTKGRKPNPMGRGVIHDEITLEKGIATAKKHDAIVKSYHELINQGMKAGQAKAHLAENFRMSFKFIESVLSIYRGLE